MKFLLGQKIGMTQIFGEDGRMVPVTVIGVMPNKVTLLRKRELHGYEAVQVGSAVFGRRSSKPRFLKEFRAAPGDMKAGDEISASVFSPSERVTVRALSKGKGFQGVVKRHGFRGGPKTHGQKDRHRAPGSIGTSFPEHVPKGRRMAGRMGGKKTTIKNLKVAGLSADNRFLFIRGAVPGRRGTLVEIRSMER